METPQEKQERKRKRCHDEVTIKIFDNEDKQGEPALLVYAQYYMLCEASPVLAAMLSGEWKESGTNILELTCNEPDVPRIFCEFSFY